MGAPPRSREQRREDTIAKLQEEGVDVWVATASTTADGQAKAHMVPLSMAWVDDHAVIAVESDSRTALNLTETGHARLAVGPTRDVVVIDAELGSAMPLEEVSADVADRYAAQADWDPRSAGGAFVYLSLRPRRIQAWREANEIAGRTLMRDGEWID
jgi:Pyridoxamine 5'-phosphate oxidase